jgi:hypothetical protein
MEEVNMSGQHEQGLGRQVWVMPDGHLPSGTEHFGRARASHEALCILNTGNTDAELELVLYFSDREPAGPYRAMVGARRTLHLRMNDLNDPEPIPYDSDYACVLRSSVPVVVQHSRLDSRQPGHALFSTIAWSE